ncbi:metallophosphoesterase [Halothece sp. PCC 7418]|uniref:3',5'-cyclic-AMP phosphodiesterase n=1 Tax=Halothece sp. (strain PCC 7418) TaxID=65093 RepID=UPI0002A08716|nr:3',5'-cyclic-AMP phosphodiesterase [Halothece sp. PCC 7418]AFZ44793.1 metallophosphoesterase [Halothece sp. PCC 7418]
MDISPLIIAQITDTHLLASSEGKLLGLPTANSLAVVIEEIQNLIPKPHCLLLTGDLSQDETLASYERLHKQISKLNIPAYWLPGNHDQFHLMEKALNNPPLYGDKSFQYSGWHFILLNSAVPGRVYGYLSKETLAWLDRELKKASNSPTVVALHHPPFLVDSHWLDKSTLQNPDDLFEVLDRHHHVSLVLFGHIHQDFQRDRAGVCYLASPSSSIQFKPSSETFALDEKKPGFRLLWFYPDGSFETKVHRVEFNYDLDFNANGY